jgi:alkyl hydroperoxide reductase subunit AhpC
MKEEFAKRNVKVLAVSIDPLDKHFGWRMILMKHKAAGLISHHSR